MKLPKEDSQFRFIIYCISSLYKMTCYIRETMHCLFFTWWLMTILWIFYCTNRAESNKTCSVNMEAQFLSRLCSIPVVSSTLDQLSAFYCHNKLSNSVVRLACETAEFGIKVAAFTTKPLLYQLEPQSQWKTVGHCHIVLLTQLCSSFKWLTIL